MRYDNADAATVNVEWFEGVARPIYGVVIASIVLLVIGLLWWLLRRKTTVIPQVSEPHETLPQVSEPHETLPQVSEPHETLPQVPLGPPGKSILVRARKKPTKKSTNKRVRFTNDTKVKRQRFKTVNEEDGRVFQVNFSPDSPPHTVKIDDNSPVDLALLNYTQHPLLRASEEGGIQIVDAYDKEPLQAWERERILWRPRK